MTPEELREAVAREMPEVLGPTHRLILADAALAAVREALREPTREMHMGAQSTTGAIITRKHSAEIWRAMLAASPLGDK